MVKHGDKEADCVQVSLTTIDEMGLEVKNGQISSFDSSIANTVMVRAVIDGKEGFSFSNKIGKEVVDRAIKMAKCAPKSEYFYGLPEKSRYPNVKVFEKEVAALDVDSLIQKAKEMIKASEGVTLAEGNISRTLASISMANSNGVVGTDRETHTQASVSMVYHKGETSSAWDYITGTSMVDIERLTREVKDKTLRCQKRVKATTPKVVILTPMVIANMLTYSFFDNLNGKNLEKKKTIFDEKKGEIIISPDLTVTDDGLMDNGVRSSRFDYEGTPKQVNTIIKKGVLKRFIYDFNTAKHAGLDSTGNADHDGIDFNNIIIEGKHRNLDEALVIDSVIGAHTANPITTDFSLKVDCAYWLKGSAVKEFMISGKVIDVLNNVLSIGKDVEQRMGIYTGGLATDALRLIF